MDILNAASRKSCMEIDYDKLAATVLRQQQQQPSVVSEAVINPSER